MHFSTRLWPISRQMVGHSGARNFSGTKRAHNTWRPTNWMRRHRISVPDVFKDERASLTWNEIWRKRKSVGAPEPNKWTKKNVYISLHGDDDDDAAAHVELMLYYVAHTLKWGTSIKFIDYINYVLRLYVVEKAAQQEGEAEKKKSRKRRKMAEKCSSKMNRKRDANRKKKWVSRKNPFIFICQRRKKGLAAFLLCIFFIFSAPTGYRSTACVERQGNKFGGYLLLLKVLLCRTPVLSSHEYVFGAGKMMWRTGRRHRSHTEYRILHVRSGGKQVKSLYAMQNARCSIWLSDNTDCWCDVWFLAFKDLVHNNISAIPLQSLGISPNSYEFAPSSMRRRKRNLSCHWDVVKCGTWICKQKTVTHRLSITPRDLCTEMPSRQWDTFFEQNSDVKMIFFYCEIPVDKFRLAFSVYRILLNCILRCSSIWLQQKWNWNAVCSCSSHEIKTFL